MASSRLPRNRDYVALASFRYALRKFLAFSKTVLAGEDDFTPEQYEALLALEAFGQDSSLTVGELSERLQVKHHSAVALTNRLVRRELVTKERGQRDARKVHVTLSASGRRFLAPLASQHHEKILELRNEMISALQQLGR